ncbi:hypothetical protein [Deinococcus hopiensis]|uniref:Uncharacterized protein n=1 Tax=Deinococcus hopiensis KR-140 TaxID=695939 RepID=A0A1W1UR96_9DEIO|nr:hypothetical protein [Deinococcus hopiensis]SMB83331.1 hypothetical protein SAMN00790413_04361 [Deinococcus hopiensis KR-140]
MNARRLRGHLPAALLLAFLTACGQGQFSNPFLVPPDLTATPKPLALTASKSACVAVTATGDGTPVTNLNLKVPGAPKELTVTTSGAGLQIQASPTTTPGAYPIIIQGSTTGGKGEGVIQVNVTAETTIPTAGFTSAFKPTALTLTVGSGSRVALQITRDANYTGQPTIKEIKPVSKQLTATLGGGDGV